jgi:hypothetical protein
MKREFFQYFLFSKSGAAALVVSCVLASMTAAGKADQVQMQNGDQYFGRVVSLSSDTLTLQSEVLGSIKLPRSRIGAINFGVNAPVVAPAHAPTNQVAIAKPFVSTNGSPELSETLRQLRTQTNLISQVQSQILGGAGSDANAKFNDLLNGLTSGQLNIGDIRAQAQDAANQLRAAKKDLHDDSGLLDAYLTVLEHFVKETQGDPAAQKTGPKPKSAPVNDE